MTNVSDSVRAHSRSVNEKPILFSAPMVRAILEGRKTQTRRIVKGIHWIADTADDVKPYWRYEDRHGSGPVVEGTMEWWMKAHPRYGFEWDRLWVKETFALQTMQRPWSDGGWAGCYTGKLADRPKDCEVIYRADNHADERAMPNGGHWRPSIFMPRWASRITLEIESVRVERLQDISEGDAKAEGIESRVSGTLALWRDYSGPGEVFGFSPVNSYSSLWESINGKGSWAANPFVWVVTFHRLEAR